MSVGVQLFCSKPFKWFEVFQENTVGVVYFCCSAWLGTPVGQFPQQSVEEIWNGENALKIRRSILDGSFRYCNRALCPYLQTITGPVQRVRDIQDDELRTVIEKKMTALPYGPRAINCSYDRSCNLFCPSCRNRPIIENDKEYQILEIQDNLQKEALKDARLLYFSGTGDPFGSPYYRKWLQTMKRKDMPNLEMIYLHTNGQLWTPKIWDTIPVEIQNLVKGTEISIDAARAQTYVVNRRGGSFEKLLNNLEFISKLRREGPLNWVRISMVVQENNFIEMPEFVQLGKRFKFDNVFFSQLLNWGTFTEDEFLKRAIHLPSHPNHHKLLELLRNEVFKESIVHLGNLTGLTERGQLNVSRT